MFQRKSGLWLCGLAVAAWAQTPPTIYSVTETSAMAAPGVGTQIYRDGQKAVMDSSTSTGVRMRSFYDLTAHTIHSWVVANPVNCSSGTFQGDWGDPFSSEDVEQMVKANGKKVGTETIAGIPSDVWEAMDPASKTKIKVWRDPKTGLYTRVDMTDPATNQTSNMMLVQQLSLAKPNPSIFQLPASCLKDGAPAKLETESEKFAHKVGGAAADYEDGTRGPGSPNGCTMLLRLLNSEMQPLDNYQLGIDLQVDDQHPANYRTVAGANGRIVFVGGHIQDYTAQVRIGMLRLENVPEHFYVELNYPNGGSSSLVYRHCAGPQTVLVFVHSGKAGEPDAWIWAKSGNYSAVPAR